MVQTASEGEARGLSRFGRRLRPYCSLRSWRRAGAAADRDHAPARLFRPGSAVFRRARCAGVLLRGQRGRSGVAARRDSRDDADAGRAPSSSGCRSASIPPRTRGVVLPQAISVCAWLAGAAGIYCLGRLFLSRWELWRPLRFSCSRRCSAGEPLDSAGTAHDGFFIWRLGDVCWSSSRLLRGSSSAWLAAASVLAKPVVTAPFLGMIYLVLQVDRLKVKGALTSASTYAFPILMVLPGVAYAMRRPSVGASHFDSRQESKCGRNSYCAGSSGRAGGYLEQVVSLPVWLRQRRLSPAAADRGRFAMAYWAGTSCTV